MFTPDMIAPCGLDCTLCYMFQKDLDPCPGCRNCPPDDILPTFLQRKCGILRCEKRLKGGCGHCGLCPDFPCEQLKEKDKSYRERFVLTESPIKNLEYIKDYGEYGFLREEMRRYTCRECGAPLCVDTGVCAGCGKRYRKPYFCGRWLPGY